MTIQAADRKVKRSFTLAPESVAFLTETRKKRCTGSDSETLDLLLRELKTEAKLRELDSAYKEYYDTVSDDVLTEEREWAQGTGQNMFVGVPE
jgi:hypothetical protein